MLLFFLLLLACLMLLVLLLLLLQHYKLKFEIIKLIITNIWKLALKTDWCNMYDNQHIEPWVKLFFTNCGILARVFQRWKYNLK
jgi:hypothetical protein